MKNDILFQCNAECCSSDYYPFVGCNCIEKGSCNVFCCNCNGGCNLDTKKLSSFLISGTPHAMKKPEEIFKEADKNKNDEISFDEAFAFAVRHGENNVKLEMDRTWFNKLDKNHNGFITVNELDK
uniref:EF-hand domain-containing protein n=1 Tax=Panagrolaimus davidi TaxID=227884 RepID=A0A914PIG4_9BILA